MFQRHLEADAVSGETAEAGAVIVLDKLGTRSNNSATLGICSSTRMATIRSVKAAMLMTTMRSLNVPLELCRKSAPVRRMADTAKSPQAPREKEKNTPPTMISSGTA